MQQKTAKANGIPNAALRRWWALAKDHDVYMELDYGFAGVIGEPDCLPPRLARRLDDWMQNLIRRCRDEDHDERWLRLKFTQQGHILRMECEAAGHPPEYGELRAAGAYLESEDMGESFYLSMEAGLTVEAHDHHTAQEEAVFPGVYHKEDTI